MTIIRTNERPRVRYFDYKDPESLKRFLNPHGRIMSRRQTKLTKKAQSGLDRAVKNARFMGFLPYTMK